MKNILITIFQILNKNEKRMLIVITFLTFGTLFLEIFGIGLLAPTMESLTNSSDEPSKLFGFFRNIFKNLNDLEFLYTILILLLAVAFFKIIYYIIYSFIKFKFLATVNHNLSKKIYSTFLNNEYKFHLFNPPSKLMKDIQLELLQFNAAFQALLQIISESFVGFGLMIFVFIIEPYGALLIGIILGLAILIFQYLVKSRLINWGKIREKIDLNLNRILFQSFSGIKNIKLYNAESFFINDYDRIGKKRIPINSKFVTVKHLPRQYLEFLTILSLLILVFINIYLEKSSSEIFQIIIIFSAASFKLIPCFNLIMQSFQTIRYSEPSIKIIYSILKDNNLKDYPANMKNKSRLHFLNKIELNDISFSFINDELVLNKINLKIQKNKTIGLIGPSGSGKTTLVDIISGLITPDDGEVLVDGVNINSNINLWQDKISYVSQNVYIFNDSILNNVAFASKEKHVDRNRALQAIKNANLLEFVKTQKNGIDQIMGESGISLSGGQLQRLGIARALYRKSEIIIFDESTSSLDNQSQKAIMDYIYNLKGKTVIIIAHRLSILDKCHTIIDLKNINNE
ncbi:ABC transporter ATP-binding protein/permease [Flavobacteriaceae bacterium]|nr:ABC transporter ATP-binding protein/permease [Flavobacteriaceae bacterium]